MFRFFENLAHAKSLNTHSCDANDVGLGDLHSLLSIACPGHAQASFRGKSAFPGALDQFAQAPERRGPNRTSCDDAGPLVQHQLVEWRLQFRKHCLCPGAFLRQQGPGINQIKIITTTTYRLFFHYTL